MSVQYRDWLHYVASKSTVYSQELLVQVSYYVSQPPSLDGTLLVSASYYPLPTTSIFSWEESGRQLEVRVAGRGQ
jgi:hypothetical protein